jgi:putative restriction endonuclease
VSNGLSLCKLHHAAFDSFRLSVTPDRSIQVRPSILEEEEEGPVLEHELKGLDGLVIQLPSRAWDKPDRDSLARHLETFRRAA